MAESSLSLGYPELQRIVGFFLGFGYDSANWTTYQSTTVDDMIKAGLRKFYSAKNWEFLKKTATLITVSSIGDYDLPDDFGYLIGTKAFATDEGFCPIEMTTSERILSFRQMNIAPGKPFLSAIRAKSLAGTVGSRSEVLFHFIPDSEYHLTYRYFAIPNAISSAFPYPDGGALHAETIKEACLSSAEEYLNDESGNHASLYQRTLATSFEIDGRQAPHFYGYNHDTSLDRPTQHITRAISATYEF